MSGLPFPLIELSSALELVGGDTYRRGFVYARDGRVLRCLWDPATQNLVGSVQGSGGRPYTATVRLGRRASGTWMAEGGACSCPVGVDCKHVAALVIAASASRKTPTHVATAAAPPAWRQSLDALVPAVATNGHGGTPM
ncbi:MAG: SWIM zinc finger family protein, partial [Mycobacterium sp.]|nr:SWIM zinc finger family protein [Mycobacterium sp.]